MTPIRIASFEVVHVNCGENPDRQNPSELWRCEFAIRVRDNEHIAVSEAGESHERAIAAALAQLCLADFELQVIDSRQAYLEASDAKYRNQTSATSTGRVNVIARELGGKRRAGAGWYTSDDKTSGLVIAAMRAVNHAGLLKNSFRANNQKALRGWAQRATSDFLQLESADPATDTWPRLCLEGIMLEYFNRVASAAVITSANHPRPQSILSLFDTSAWLFDGNGQLRESFTETDSWLAWYPGLGSPSRTVKEVIESMPAAPDIAIPRVVKLFENPGSWLRFRGAIDLDDHDVLHVLLGRGLQDQDEAFVLGFAMGTSKRVGWIERRVFKFILARLYPEPYKIPAYLHPAFDLGIECGKETGVKDLFKLPLNNLTQMTLAEARERIGIEPEVLRRFFRLEQQQIPSTIASMRLP